MNFLDTTPPKLLIPLLYAIFGILWINLSDELLLFMTEDIKEIIIYQSYKGWLYIFLTTLLLYLLLQWHEKVQNNARNLLTLAEKKYNLLHEEAESQAQLGSWEQTNDEDLHWSNEVYHIFEYDLETNMSFELFLNRIHPEDKDELITAFQNSIKEQSKYYIEHRLLFDNGRIKYVIEKAEHFFDMNNNLIRTIGTVQDITERKEAELRLKKSEEIYKSLIQQAHYSTEVYDINGFQIEANSAYEKLWNISKLDTIQKINLLTDKKFKNTGLIDFVKRAYKGEFIELPAYTFDFSISIDIEKKIGRKRIIKTQISPIKDIYDNVKNIVVTHIDLTDKVNIEKEMQKKETILNSVFQVIPDLLFIMKNDGIIIDYRSQTDNNLYIESNKFLGKYMQETLPEEVGYIFDINIKELSKKDPLKIFQYELEIKNEKKHFEARMAKLPNDDKIMTIIRDITEQVLIDEQLKFQALLLEQSLAATDVVNEEGKFTYVNDAYVQMWGYNSKEELLKTTPFEHCIDPTMPETIIKTVQQKGEELFHFKALRKDGTTFDALMAVKYINLLNKKFYIGSTMDISKHIEQEAFINAITDTSPAMIYVYDFEKKSNIYVNNNTTQLLGYTTDEMTQMKDQLFQTLIHPEDIKRVIKHQEKILKGDENTVYEIEYRIKHKNGSWLTYHSYERPFLHTAGQEIKQKIGIALDITDLRDKEHILLFQSRLAAMGEMIDNIAHQWRQPLSAISTAATGAKLQKELDCLSDKELNSALTTINSSTQYLSQTIEDFRDFFKPNKDKKEFYIHNSIKRLLVIVKSRLNNKQIEIIQNIEEIKIFGIENELVQALMNIFTNAIDALENKKKTKKYIFINIYEKDNRIFISIKDNAGGVPLEISHKIFESRFSTKKQGSGIGLYMTKNIIKNLKGSLDFKNSDYMYDEKDYKGADFIINIPKNLDI